MASVPRTSGWPNVAPPSWLGRITTCTAKPGSVTNWPQATVTSLPLGDVVTHGLSGQSTGPTCGSDRGSAAGVSGAPNAPDAYMTAAAPFESLGRHTACIRPSGEMLTEGLLALMYGEA